MPSQTVIHPELDLIVTRHAGVVGRVQLRNNLRKAKQLRAYRPGMRRLVDTSRVEAVEISFLAMMRRAEEVASWFNAQKLPTLMCLYAPGDAVFGMARMFQSLVSVGETCLTVEVVDTLEAAGAVLGLDPGILRALLADEVDLQGAGR